jgi:hypothetical protein
MHQPIGSATISAYRVADVKAVFCDKSAAIVRRMKDFAAQR